MLEAGILHMSRCYVDLVGGIWLSAHVILMRDDIYLLKNTNIDFTPTYINKDAR